MNLRWPALLVLPLALTACHRAPKLKASATDLRMLDGALAQITPKTSDAEAFEILTGTLSELDLGRSESCKDWLGTVLVTHDPAQRAQALARAAELCHFRCTPASDSTAALAQRCADDPLLAAHVAAGDRDALSPTMYLWLRGLLEQAHAGLAANGTPHATRDAEQVDAKVPVLVKVARQSGLATK